MGGTPAILGDLAKILAHHGKDAWPVFSKALPYAVGRSTPLDSVPLEDLLGSVPILSSMPDVGAGARVFVRGDLDVPVKGGEVQDVARLESLKRTIDFCADRGWRPIIFGHIGRDPSATLRPVVPALQRAIGRPVAFLDHWLDEDKCRVADALRAPSADGNAQGVLLLENTRRFSIERAFWDPGSTSDDTLVRRAWRIAIEMRDAVSSRRMTTKASRPSI